MRCSVCTGELKGAVYTIHCLTLSGRALGMNLCRTCLRERLGRPAIRALDQLLDTTGWTQPALLIAT